MKFSPIVSIQGARQVGKSYLARELVPVKISDLEYFTLDHKDLRDFAENNPYSFLTQSNSRHLVIDEVQKAPALFHEMKAIVDKKRTPGKFLILGSTEFSHETQIKESLTGRLSRIRIFPFNLAEAQKLEMNSQKRFPFLNVKPRVNRNDLLKYLERGGLPGIFIVKNESERRSLLSDWLRLTTERDLHQIKKYKLDSDLAYKIIEQIAIQNNSSLNQISKELSVSVKRVQNHIHALKTLFVIFEVSQMKGSPGKTMYYLMDVGLLSYFNATFEKKMITWHYLELLSQLSYKGYDNLQFHYYKSTTGSIVQLLYTLENELYANKIIFNESYDKRDYIIFQSLQKKYVNKFKKIHCHAFFGGQHSLKHEDVGIFPWESVV